jgi:hypothetical protein
VFGFDDEHRTAAFRQHDGGGQAVGTRTNHNSVVRRIHRIPIICVYS